MKIRKAVIPAAGFGTRFLPQTKAMPKEMIPVVDKPVIQYVVEEVVKAGVQDIIIVTGWSKRAVEDHFDHNAELERLLEAAGKHEKLEQIRRIAQLANFVYIRQKGPRGTATTIINSRPIIGNEPFFYLFGDEFLKADPPHTKQLADVFKRFPGQILSAIRTKDPKDTVRYGFAGGKEVAPGVLKVKRVVEKPGPENVPSDYAVVSGFIFTPKIFEAIDGLTDPKPGEELHYIDALNALLKRGEPVYAVEIKNGRYHDCGNVLEYLKTVVETALTREDIGNEFLEFLRTLT